MKSKQIRRTRRTQRLVLFAVLWLCIGGVFAGGTILINRYLNAQNSTNPVVDRFDFELERKLEQLPEDWQLFVRENPQAMEVAINRERYPQTLMNALLSNAELLPLAEDYFEKKDQTDPIDIQEDLNVETVHFYQWDERWGYRQYGEDMMALTGCGPTALAIVAGNLLRDASINPYTVAQYAMANGYYVDGSGSSWLLMSEGAAAFGLSAYEIGNDEASIRNVLENGGMIIAAMGPGDFTSQGHLIVLCSVDAQGNYQISDPNRTSTTAQSWTFEQLTTQFLGLWAYGL